MDFPVVFSPKRKFKGFSSGYISIICHPIYMISVFTDTETLVGCIETHVYMKHFDLNIE